jgi:hypothetical protein
MFLESSSDSQSLTCVIADDLLLIPCMPAEDVCFLYSFVAFLLGTAFHRPDDMDERFMVRHEARVDCVYADMAYTDVLKPWFSCFLQPGASHAGYVRGSGRTQTHRPSSSW